MAGLKARKQEDSRQIDDLVSFINGGDGGKFLYSPHF